MGNHMEMNKNKCSYMRKNVIISKLFLVVSTKKFVQNIYKPRNISDKTPGRV